MDADELAWYCVRHLVKTLLEQDQLDAAIDLLQPFVDSGWWEAMGTRTPEADGSPGLWSS